MGKRQRRDFRSAAATLYRAWYKTAAWLAIRTRRLSEEPLCRMCAALGFTKAATVCDHIKPHRGDRALFFDFENTQSLCKRCHDKTKQAEEARGHVIGCDIKGRPRDPNHPWNR